MSTKLRTKFSSISELCGANWIRCDSPTLVLAAGMSFNPIFTSIAFRQKAGELAPFSTLGIPLVHGWLVDPASPEEYAAVSRVEDYYSAQDRITRLSRLDMNLNEEEKQAGEYT
jgi:MINDY deubiquitinase